MITRQEIEKQIDFNVDDEAVLDEFISSQHQTIEAAYKPGGISDPISLKDISFESVNTMTFYYVMERSNITKGVRYFIENCSELPDSIDELLFEISSKLLLLTNSIVSEHHDFSTQSIIHEIVCEELVRELAPEYKELVEMAREGESLC